MGRVSLGCISVELAPVGSPEKSAKHGLVMGTALMMACWMHLQEVENAELRMQLERTKEELELQSLKPAHPFAASDTTTPLADVATGAEPGLGLSTAAEPQPELTVSSPAPHATPAAADPMGRSSSSSSTSPGSGAGSDGAGHVRTPPATAAAPSVPAAVPAAAPGQEDADFGGFGDFVSADEHPLFGGAAAGAPAKDPGMVGSEGDMWVTARRGTLMPSPMLNGQSIMTPDLETAEAWAAEPCARPPGESRCRLAAGMHEQH